MRVFPVPRDLSLPGIWELAGKIRELEPAELVFVDHYPPPPLLTSAIQGRYGTAWKASRPRMILHAYGDFTLRSRSWHRFGELARGADVQIVCASSRQVRMVSRFLAAPADVVCRSPFPVDERDYGFDP
ncbi:MAG TPA: hypothetical protein VM598_05595, partial [Bdellovibrionota bacterium]|nr:hypothetical protein [Bdellovibrionota bacterium]